MSNHQRATARRLLIPGFLLFSLAGGGWLLFSDRLSPEEQALIGTWYDARPYRDARIVELRADRTIVEGSDGHTRALGHWRLENDQIVTFVKTPLIDFSGGPVNAALNLWQKVTSKLNRGGPRRAKQWWNTPQRPGCYGVYSRNGVVVGLIGPAYFGGGGYFVIPDDDQLFVRSLSKAIERDRQLAAGELVDPYMWGITILPNTLGSQNSTVESGSDPFAKPDSRTDSA